MTISTPYDPHRESDVWKVIDEAIRDLVNNHDLVENTRRDYIVGYICQKLQEQKGKS
jgi:hypothetical protein